jgi:hypothetical protein
MERELEELRLNIIKALKLINQGAPNMARIVLEDSVLPYVVMLQASFSQNPD